MRITNISITNLAAFTEFSVSLPAVGLIEGKHGAGKSSLERCIMYIFGLRPLAEKGQKSIMHDPTILHGNAEKGECVISFDDGALESLRVRVTADRTERTVKVRGKKSWELAGQQIYDITNALSYDPLQFRELNPKERLEAFLKVVPIQIDKQEIIDAIGGVIPFDGTPSLEDINAIHDDIYAERRNLNVQSDTQAKHAAQLAAALGPADPDEGWEAKLKALREDKTTLERSEHQEIARIGRELASKKDGFAAVRRTLDADTDRSVAGEIEVIDREIRELEARKANIRERAAVTRSEHAEIETANNETARTQANAEVAEIRSHNAPKHSQLTADIATAEERARKSAMDQGTRLAAESARAEATGFADRAAKMTEALDRLKALKAAVASRMVIKGVQIASPREGLPVDICREESGALVPFSRWNDADADAFCLRLAVLYRGACGLVMVDNTGNWSPARRAQIIERCKALAKSDNMQFLLGQATDDGALTVKGVE